MHSRSESLSSNLILEPTAMAQAKITAQIVQYSRKKLWRTAVHLLNRESDNEASRKKPRLDLIMCTATISSCEKGQQWITVMSLLREMRQCDHLQLYHQLSKKGQQWMAVIPLLQVMQQRQLKLSAIT